MADAAGARSPCYDHSSMAPKFRGNSEDWLDDESGQRANRKGKKPGLSSGKAQFLPAEEANATVAEVFPNQCRVRMDGELELQCNYRRAGVIGRTEWRERSPVAVGDRVKVTDATATTGVVSGVCERKNSVHRPAPGREGTDIRHVIAANVELLCIVASVRSPDFSPGLVDRFLIAAGAEGIPALIAVTKADLIGPDEPWEIYRKLGYEVLEASAREGRGIPALKARLEGRLVVFCGHSGVGKTSLLNALLGTSKGKVGDVSEITGKGRHTTSSAVLIGGPGTSRWVDTPGVREFGLTDVKAEELLRFFPELDGLPCAQDLCRHVGEPGCAATSEPRYASYRRIHESLLA
jgi:ribosome biogenesis GTPase / thiamine phosphate phosphatase